MTQMITQLPDWVLIRISGLLSYFLLYAGVALGILHSMPYRNPIWKGKLYRWHSYSLNSGLIVFIIHALLLIVDTYMPFTWKEVFIPFAAANHPFWNGLGTLSLYGAAFIIFTTDFKAWFGRRIWKAFHFTAYPVFLAGLLHGIFTGTDTNNSFVSGFYAFTCVSIVLLTAIRGFVRPKTGKERSRDEDLARRGRREAGNADSVQAKPGVSQRRLGPGLRDR